MARKKSEVIEEVINTDVEPASEPTIEEKSVEIPVVEEVVAENSVVETPVIEEVVEPEKPKTHTKKVTSKEVSDVAEAKPEIAKTEVVETKSADDEIKSIVVQNTRIYLAPNTKCTSTLYSGVVTMLSEDNGFCKVIYRVSGNSICTIGYIQL